MYFPEDARIKLQAYIDAGKFSYDMLDNETKRLFNPPPTPAQKQATLQTAQRQQSDATAMSNIDQADQTARNRRVSDNIDPALVNVSGAIAPTGTSNFHQLQDAQNQDIAAKVQAFEDDKKNRNFLNPYIPEEAAQLLDRGQSYYYAPDNSDSGLTSFGKRLANEAHSVMTMENPVYQVDTGNKAANTAADLLGFGAGLVNPAGEAGAVSSLSGGAMKLADYTLSPLAPKLAGLAEKGVLGKGATRAIHGATAGGLYGTTEGIAQGKSTKDTAINAIEQALMFGGAEAGIGGVGDVLSPVVSSVVGDIGKYGSQYLREPKAGDLLNWRDTPTLGKGATKVEPKVSEPVQPQMRDVAPLATADQGLSDVGNIEKPISVKPISGNLPESNSYWQLVAQEIDRLKGEGKQGVMQGGLGKDFEGNVIKAWGRKSLNPKWYQDLYLSNATEKSPAGRPPTTEQYKNLGIENLRNGTERFDGSPIPANTEFLRLERESQLGRQVPPEWANLEKVIQEVNANKDYSFEERDRAITELRAEQDKLLQPEYKIGIKRDIPLGKWATSSDSLIPQRPIRMPSPMSEVAMTDEGLGKGATTPTVSGLGKGALPSPQSKIIIGKQKEPLNFKDALNKFYARIVNDQQPIWNTDAKTGEIASNTKNVSGIVDYNLLKGLVDKDGNQVGESLQKTVEAIPKGQEEEFWTYMSQLHNIDRAREGKSVQANYTPEMSAEAVKIAERSHPEYKTIGNNIIKWIDDFMQTWGVDTGIVDKDIYANLRETYPNYFPTQRDFSELEKSIPDNVSQKFADQRTPIKKATGSERDIIDPVENIMNLVNRTIRAAKYNEVGQSLLDTVRENPEKMKPFAEEIPVKDGMFTNTDNVISVLEDGKAKYLKINNKPLLDAMQGLPKSIGELPFNLGKPIQLFKDLITQKNPFFAIRNVSRDIPTAYVYGSEHNPLKFGTDLLSAGKDMLTNSPNYQKYQAVGGGGANFFSASDAPQAAAKLTNIGKRDALINQMPQNGMLGKGATWVVNAVLHPLDSIEKFNNLTETAPRLAEFNRVLDKTGSVTEALHAANDVTVNFSRGGNTTKAVDKAVPYLNAGVQGLDKFFRGFKDPKTALATIIKSGVAITAPDIVLYMVNKDNPDYQALDNRTKDTYFLIPKSDGTFIKISKSRELGVLFGSLFERVLRQQTGQSESFKGFGNSVATNFAPTNPLDNNIISPYFNLKSNKDFADRAIVPQGMLMDKRSPYLQYDDKTTAIAKKIGELTKGIPVINNSGGLSPKQLDYLAKSYTGVIGQFGIPLAVPGGSPLKALKTQFTSDPTFSNQVTTDFYDKLDKLSAAATDKNLIGKIPGKTLTPEENIKNSMQGVSTALSRGTKLINQIQSSDAADKDAQIKAIKTQMLDLTNKAVAANDVRSMQVVENQSKKLFLIKK